jgi:hypothetical protein
VRTLDNEGIIPVLARAVREVENAVQRGPVAPSVRTKFQVVALLVREERATLKADAEATEAHRAGEHRDDALVVEDTTTALVARGCTTVRRLALALSSQGPLLRSARVRN